MTPNLLISLLIALAQAGAAPGPPDGAASVEKAIVAQAPMPDLKSILDSSSPDRPAWIDEKPSTLSDGTFVTKLSVGPYSTVEECQAQLDLELPDQVNRYIERALWRESGDAWVDVPLEYIHAQIAAPDASLPTPYVERRQHTVGTMYTLHVRLKYDRKVQGELRAMARQSLVNSRLRLTGAGAALVLALLGTMFGYLKIDAATRGGYRWRLKTGAALVAGGLLTVGWRIFQV